MDTHNTAPKSTAVASPATSPLPAAKLPPSSGAQGKVTFGKFWRTPKQQPSAMETAGNNAPLQGDQAPSLNAYRFQVRLESGFFTEALKDELLGGLETLLYQLPPNSFIPGFNGCGLRYGKVWFSPENQASRDWLQQKLLEINERALIKLVIEEWSLHQNKVCLNVPVGGGSSARLSDHDILKRLQFLNPWAQIDRWRAVSGMKSNKGGRLLFVTVDNDSVSLLKKQKWKLNYRFQKVSARLLEQKSAQ